MTFSEALQHIKDGKAVQRTGWNGKGLKVRGQFPDEHSKMTLPYAYIEYPVDHSDYSSARCPWLASQTDIFAEDWQLAD